MMSRLLPAAVTLPLLLTLGLSACSEPTTNAIDTQPRPVKLTTVSAGNEPRLRQFPAVVEAANVAELTFRVAGELSQLPGRPGVTVARGDLIAKLDPRDYQLVVDEAKARYELAESQYTRSQNLVEQGLMSASQFDEITSQMRVAKANLETAQANLNYTELRAPFAGVVAHLYVENYENIQAKQPIATLQMNDAIDISISVPENLFARVQRRVDYQPDVIFEAAPKRAFKASLKEWDSQADAATNTYEVVFTMAKPRDLNILPGMSATVVVDTSAVIQYDADALFVPASAVFTPADNGDSDAHYVWRYQGDNERGQVEKVKVSVADISNAGIAITAGLKSGDQVVSAGVNQLQDGQLVRPWTRERGL